MCVWTSWTEHSAKRPRPPGDEGRTPEGGCRRAARADADAAGRDERVALTSYLGVEGTDRRRRDGVLYRNSRVQISHVTDGTSNTLLVGERPPSPELIYGWWYAGDGLGGTGALDVVLGVREPNSLNPYPQYVHCGHGPFPFRPGRVDDYCSVFQFWSLHSGGANFLFADGSVWFLLYDADPILPALATRAGGEAVALPD